MFANRLFNVVAGHIIVDTRCAVEEIAANHASTINWWKYLLVVSTVLPSAANLVIGGLAITCGAPGLPKKLLELLPADRSPPISDRGWIAFLWCVQLYGGLIAGILVLIGIGYLLIFVLLPSFGIGLEQLLDQVSNFVSQDPVTKCPLPKNL
jgi:hypothetical protein